MKPKTKLSTICAGKLHSIMVKPQLFVRTSAGVSPSHKDHPGLERRMWSLRYRFLSHSLTCHSFLGVALTKVLLESRGHNSRRPILVVCTTNHALDSFLKDIQQAGVVKFVRLGGNSKETWTKAFSLRAAARGLKKTTLERSSVCQAHRQVEGGWSISCSGYSGE